MSGLEFKEIESRDYTVSDLSVLATLYYGFGRFMVRMVLFDKDKTVKQSYPPFPENWEDYNTGMLASWFDTFGFQRMEISEIHAKLVLDKWFSREDKHYDNIINILNFEK